MTLKDIINKKIHKCLSNDLNESNNYSYEEHRIAAHNEIKSKLKPAHGGDKYSEQSKEVIMGLPEHKAHVRRLASTKFASQIIKPLAKEIHSNGGSIDVTPYSHGSQLRTDENGIGTGQHVDVQVNVHHEDPDIRKHYQDKMKHLFKQHGYSHVDSPVWERTTGFNYHR